MVMGVMGITHKEGMMRQGRAMVGIVVLTVMVSVGAVRAESLKGKSLYERLGGKEAITAVVDTFVGNVGADKRIHGYFAMLGPAALSLLASYAKGSS